MSEEKELSMAEAVELLERQKGISRQAIIRSIEDSVMAACKENFGKNDNINVVIDPVTCDMRVTAEKEVVASEDEIVDPVFQLTVEEARKYKADAADGDIIEIELDVKSFGRRAASNARNVITQKIRDEERSIVYNRYIEKLHEMISGTISRRDDKGNYYIALDSTEAQLPEKEQIKSERLRVGSRVKVYVCDVKMLTKGGVRITVSRTHAELVRKLFEEEVTEIRDGIVEIKGIAREPGSRTKMAVHSTRDDVDPVGSCVGMNGSRVNAVVDELGNEKIDIVLWDENPAILIENALSPAKVVAVAADEDTHEAKVIVPDYQLSLAIGKEGQNARLAARLTRFKIDIKSESQAKVSEDFAEFYEDEYSVPDLVEDNGADGEAYEEYSNMDLVGDGEAEAAADVPGVQEEN